MTNTPPIRQITVLELKSMLSSAATPLELWDVRTEAERRLAKIEGARHLNQEAVDYLDGLDRNTLLVFHCHHGMRSQNAAQHFVSKGFTNVCNVTGGIEAWSVQVDASVPRY